MKQTTKSFALAAGVLALTAGSAAAATVTNDLNLRHGPGTEYRVVTSMPAGVQVDVDGCRGNWCRVNWRGYSGYASASYLSGGSGYVRRRAPRYYDSPRYRRYGYGPGFGLTLRLGDDDHDRRRGRRGRHRDRH